MTPIKENNLDKDINLKYYAFDWDDNILIMPTTIIVKTDDGNEIGISTEEFANYRSEIGIKPFKYKNKTIVGYADNPFRNFSVEGDRKFIIDVFLATEGPSWKDFVECINSGSIFGIITARGHHPNTLKEAVYNMIMSNYKGINLSSVLDSLTKYRKFMDKKVLKSTELVKQYLDKCKFYPVSYNNENTKSPETEKVNALKEFIKYIKHVSSRIGEQAILKNGIKNNFIPTIGFSDDDPKNIKNIKDYLDKNYEKSTIKTFLTKDGKKREV